MPTGYTADVQSGKVTDFPEFAMQCARAFGALITMRDDPQDAPVPDEFKPDDYYQQSVDDAKSRLASLRGMSEIDVESAYQTAKYDAERYNETRDVERSEQKRRYEAMLAKAEAWNPPSSDHVQMKKFMLEQLRESIMWDCSPPGYRQEVAATADEWHVKEIAGAERDVANREQSLREEVTRCASRSLWVRQLRESLKAEKQT